MTRPAPTPPEAVRGTIEGFSNQAASRLRAFTMEHDVPVTLRIAFTFTTRRETTPADWRRFMNAMKMRFTREGWAAIWRIELQRRGVPHLHVAAFLDALEIEAAVAAVRRSWLEVTDQAGDLAARRHAIRWKPITSGGWAVYQALHDGKGKTEQLGWKGKQWGIWNRKVFARIEPEVGELSDAQDVLFRRWMTRLLLRKGARMKVPKSGTFQRMCNTDTIRKLYFWVLGERPVGAPGV